MRRLGLLFMLAACGGGGDANVNGTYTLNVTNRENPCDLPLYQVGATATSTIVIAQNKSDLTGTVTPGGGAGYLDLVLGSHVFTGGVDGDSVDMRIVGGNAQTRGNCAFTYNARFKGTADGDALDGRVEYTTATNNNPDCAANGLTSCVTVQEYTGTRPPS